MKLSDSVRVVKRLMVFILAAVLLLQPLIFTNIFNIQSVEASTNPNTIRVIEVRYFPQGEQAAIYHPDTLSTSLQNLLGEASKFHGYSDPSATSSVDVEIVSVYNRYSARPNPDGTWEGTYNAILAQDNLCNVINTQDIDQVWLWVDPRPGFDTNPGVEYAISSPYFDSGAQFATVPSTPFCGGQNSFLFMGFDYSRTVDNALHSFGHMMEGLLGNLQTVELFWYRFGGNDLQGYSLAERCGNVHFPPNGVADYDYSNITFVDTYCEDWNPYGTGIKTTYNCTRWGCNQEGYLVWWLQNIPNENSGIMYQGQELPSWWDFVYDIDANISQYASNPNYFMDLDFLGLNPTNCNVTVEKASSASVLNIGHDGCGNDDFLALTASYRATANQNTHRISSAQYNSQNMTFGCAANSNEYVTELWYFDTPTATGSIDLQWNLGNASDIVIGVTSLEDISNTTPVTNLNCSSDGGAWSSNPTIGMNPEVTIASNTGDIIFGAVTSYTGNNNTLTNDLGTELWSDTTTNVVSTGLIADSTSSSTTVGWTATASWPWSTAAMSLQQEVIITNPPVIASIANQSVEADTPFVITAAAADPDVGDTLTYSLDQAPTGMSINSTTGEITWTPTNANLGDSVVTVRVTDSTNLFDTTSFTITVTAPVACTGFVTTEKTSSASSISFTHDGCADDDLVALIASYRGTLSHTSHRINSATYNTQNLTFACSAHSNEYITELWYFDSPVAAGGIIDLAWNLGSASDIVIGVKSFQGLNTNDPIEDFNCTSDGGVWSSNPTIGTNPEVTVNSDTNQQVFAGMTTYTGGPNTVTNDIGTELWNDQTTNVLSSALEVSGTSPSVTAKWTGNISWPWSAAAVSLKPFVANTPPVITEILDQSVTASTLFTLNVAANDADSGDVVTYSLDQAPATMSINSSTGEITWTPTTSDQGTNNVTVRATDTAGTFDTEDFSVEVTIPSIDLNAYPLISYAGGQDSTGTATISGDGLSLTLIGNRWKALDIPAYTVTQNTVIEFDFTSSSEGEIHGIGLDENLGLSSNRIFKVHGTQNWGIRNFDDYASTAPNTKHYVIPIGQLVNNRLMNYLVFVMDHDISNPTGESVFSNVKLYELE